MQVLRALALGLVLGIVLLVPEVVRADIMSNLALYWRLDEGTGSSAGDSSGNGVNGTLGASTAAPTWLTGASCKFGNCLSFDGSNDVVTLSLATGTSYTIALWVYNDSTATGFNYTTLFSLSGAASGLFLMQTGGNANQLNMYYSGADHFSSGTVPTDTWAHIAVTVNAGAVTFYINGSSSGTASSGPSFTATTVGLHDTSQEAFKGRIDEFRVYSRALSSGDITELVTFRPSGDYVVVY